MPIEIRELIIKTTVQQASPTVRNGGNEPVVDKAALKKELMTSCKKMVKQMMKEQRER